MFIPGLGELVTYNLYKTNTITFITELIKQFEDVDEKEMQTRVKNMNGVINRGKDFRADWVYSYGENTHAH